MRPGDTVQSLIIRPYTAADRADCLAIFHSNVPEFFTFEEEVLYADWLNSLCVPESARDAHGEIHYFVAESDKRVLACGGWGIREEADHATLVWGAVHRDFHKQGIGHALTAFRIGNSRQHYAHVPMTIDTSHLTAPFYQRFGFRAERFTENGYAPRLHRVDMRLIDGKSDHE